jgi:phytanoyl-CoA hydroxylase
MTPLTDVQVAQFHKNGVLLAEEILTEADLQPVIDGYTRWLDRRAGSLDIPDRAESLPFERRLARLRAQNPEIEKGMDVMHARLPEFFEFLHCRSLLDAAAQLLGTHELTANPIQHIRGKVTDNAESSYFNVPWHQDAAVTWEEADDTPILTCWIPLVDATIENGCMEILPGVWKQGVLRHIAGGGGATIDPEALPEVSPIAGTIKKRGVIFMHRCTPHRSTPNRTDLVRWSLDLRFQPSGLPTGRPFHPEFVVRSEQDPASARTDHAEWSKRWEEALAAPMPARGAHRISM